MTITSDAALGAGALPVFKPGRRSRAFAGVISLLALLTLVVDLAWAIMAGQFFLLQLPIFVGSLFLLLFFGLGYIINPPPWVGVFALSLLYFAQDFTLRQGLVGGGGTDLQSLVKGLIAALLLGYGLFNGLSKTTRHPVLGLWLVYALFAAFTASYSSARALGIGSGMALVGIALGTAQAASRSEKGLAAYWVGLYSAAVLASVLSLILLATVPMMARDLADPGAFRLRGVTGSANSLGPIMAVGMIIGLSMVKRTQGLWGKRLHWVFILTLLVALVLTNSRSSMIGAVAGVAAVAVIRRQQGILTLLLVALGASLAAVTLLVPSLMKNLAALVVEFVSRSGNVHEITSFTGRSDIWVASVKLIQAKLWFGYGLGSVRVELPKVFFDAWGNTTTTAHNFVLESMISVGLVGTLMLTLVFVTATVGLLRFVGSAVSPFQSDETKEWSVCALRCMMMLWVHSLVERAFAGTAAPSTVVLGLCVATYVFVALQVRDVAQRRMSRIQALG